MAAQSPPGAPHSATANADDCPADRTDAAVSTSAPNATIRLTCLIGALILPPSRAVHRFGHELQPQPRFRTPRCDLRRGCGSAPTTRFPLPPVAQSEGFSGFRRSVFRVDVFYVSSGCGGASSKSPGNSRSAAVASPLHTLLLSDPKFSANVIALDVTPIYNSRHYSSTVRWRTGAEYTNHGLTWISQDSAPSAGAIRVLWSMASEVNA